MARSPDGRSQNSKSLTHEESIERTAEPAEVVRPTSFLMPLYRYAARVDDYEKEQEDNGEKMTRSGTAPADRNINMVSSLNDLERERQLFEASTNIENWLKRSMAGSPTNDQVERNSFRERDRSTLKQQARSRSSEARSDVRKPRDPQVFDDRHIPGPGVLIDVYSDDHYSDGESSYTSSYDLAREAPESPPASVNVANPDFVQGHLPRPDEQDPLPHQFHRRDMGQPASSNQALMQFQLSASKIETASRAATWGTRRSSRSDDELESVVDGTQVRPAPLREAVQEISRSSGAKTTSPFQSPWQPSSSKSDVPNTPENASETSGTLGGHHGSVVPSLPPVMQLRRQIGRADQAKSTVDRAKHLFRRVDIEMDEGESEDNDVEPVKMELPVQAHNITPDLDGFKVHARQLNPRLEPYLVKRIAQDQLQRYEKLLKNKIEHTRGVSQGRCASGPFCTDLGGKPKVLPPSSSTKDTNVNYAQFRVRNGSDDDSGESAFKEGLVTPALFPAGIPLPPTSHLPAEFECPLCFQVKKFMKPSDWTKHVHEDVQPFSCTFANCPEPKSFRRKADWVRHENERHRHLEWWSCSIPECAHICYRKDNFIQHLVREHKIVEPKAKSRRENKGQIRTTTQSAKELDSDAHEFRDLVNHCRHETMLTPRHEPCKFCGNVCSTWKKLAVHIGKHMEQIAVPVLDLIAKQNVVVDTIVNPVDLSSQPLLHVAVPETTEPDVSNLDTSSPYHVSAIPSHDVPYSDHQGSTSRHTWTDSGYHSILRPGGLPPRGEKSLQESSKDVEFTGSESNIINDESCVVEDAEDNKTDYSVATSIESVQKFANVSDVAEHLRQCLQQDIAGTNSNIPDRLCSELPNLLKRFAVRLGGSLDASVDGVLHTAYFIHKHALLISNDLRQQQSDGNEGADNLRHSLPESTLQKPDVSSWLETVDPRSQNVQLVQDHDHEGDHDGSIDGSDYDDAERANLATENHRFHQHLDLVKDTSAYRWFREALRNLLKISYPEDSNSTPIKDKIKAYVRRYAPALSNKVSKRRATATTRAVFHVHWNPFLYSNYQDFDCSHEEVLKSAITVTGTLLMAQAATVSQYVEQIWPTIGKELLTLVQYLMKDRDRPHKAHLSDGTSVELSFLGGVLKLEMNGIQDAIIEIVEVFAWLGAVLRVSAHDKHLSQRYVPNMTICTPCVTRPIPNAGSEHHLGQEATTLVGQITFDDRVQDLTELNGTCWRHMFQEKVIASGFPVLARVDAQPGLELPLNMMAALMATKHTNVFNDTTYVKGFSSMLVPTQRRSNLLLWHMLYKADGCRVSYLDVDLPVVSGITNETLQSTRHIVGWCSDAKLYAGSRDACHSIDRTDLPRTGSTCFLDKITLSGGMYVTGGAEIVLSRREKPIRISRNGQRDKMEWLRQKYVVLWDQDESRGWLVNGTTALLHLTLSSLKQDERIRKSFKFQWDRLKDAELPNMPDSAYEMLVDQSNLDIELYSDKTEVFREVIETSRSKEEVKKTVYTYFLLADRVDELYMLIEKMVDYQADALNKQGVALKVSMRKNLEGWEFKDIYCRVDPISPRILKLPALGDGWVDLVHSLGAITLFGNGFGDLIQPTGSDLCSYWKQLPSQEYYLAACVSDLRNMIELLGTSRCDPIKLTREVSWRQSPIQKCQCTTSHQKHSSVALALETKCKSKRLPQTSAVFEGYAAVVLSHKGKIRMGRQTSDVDSGLGESVDSSISRLADTLPSDSQQQQEASTSLSGSSSTGGPNVMSPPISRKRLHGEEEEDAPAQKRSILSIRRLMGS